MLFGGFRPADNSNDVRDDGEGFRANALVDPGKEAARRMAAIKPEDRISFMMLEYFLPSVALQVAVLVCVKMGGGKQIVN